MTDTNIIEDLAASGLIPSDISMRTLGSPERAATNTPFSTAGYVIPYFNLQGKPVSFYRVKLFNHDPKYKQPKETPNHIYFPKGFETLAKESDYVIITEGEKKAALAVKRGYPCVAFGGVDSWKNRVVTLPVEAEMSQNKNQIRAKLPAGEIASEDYMSPLALGLQELIDFVLQYKKTLIIIYDTDSPHGTSHQVQRAAAALGFELRFRGVPFAQIRQIMLPQLPEMSKVGLDDFLMEAHPNAFPTLIEKCLTKKGSFPRHPNIKDFLNKRLQNPHMSRKEMQAVSIAVLSELDAGGLRLRSTAEQQSYYFDRETHKLIRAQFTGAPNELTENAFGQFLYRKFGLGAADHRVIQWLGTQFTGEAPVEDVTPHRVIARVNPKDDSVTLQLSDGQYAVVNRHGLHIQDNGSNGILFESDHIKGIDIDKLVKEYNRLVREPLHAWWMDVLLDVRLRDKDKQRAITALLFYIAPWLYRWRGMQLPIEMTLGEAGSGKSTLQELRLNIITGEAKLRNSPQDIKDWHASVANSGGLHVTDNVQLLDRNLRQRLSDEICRIITEPDPSIEMRRYYTNADLMRIPVRCVFGITAIAQPFQNTDILQRAILIELDKSKDIQNGSLAYDSNWQAQQLQRFGGRESWLAHHLVVLTMFFREVAKSWNMKYAAKHRLINFEQTMCTMARVFGIDPKWVPDYLTGVTNRTITDADWAMEGLITFSAFWRIHVNSSGKQSAGFTCQDIANWAMGTEEFEKCEQLTNSRKLGRYMKTHAGLVATSVGIVEDGSQNNRQRYRLSRGN